MGFRILGVIMAVVVFVDSFPKAVNRISKCCGDVKHSVCKMIGGEDK